MKTNGKDENSTSANLHGHELYCFSKPAITHTQAAIKNTNQQNKRVHRAFLTSMNFLFLSLSFPQKLMKHFKSKTGSTQDRKCL